MAAGGKRRALRVPACPPRGCAALARGERPRLPAAGRPPAAAADAAAAAARPPSPIAGDAQRAAEVAASAAPQAPQPHIDYEAMAVAARDRAAAVQALSLKQAGLPMELLVRPSPEQLNATIVQHCGAAKGEWCMNFYAQVGARDAGAGLCSCAAHWGR